MRPPSGFDIDRFPISVSEFVDYRDASNAYEVMGIYTSGTKTLTGEGGDPLRVPTTFLDHAALIRGTLPNQRLIGYTDSGIHHPYTTHIFATLMARTYTEDWANVFG